ncbi:DUF805 domain-containing protein [Yersinia sp. 1652 StPb PI]|uniref:DUF805 domain-containing protein n=2 Tax=unclassified Yersinia (in: enterobacteria) TaxID=2653513 RepID=UPI00355BD218
MVFWQCYLNGWQRTFDFKGVSSRQEFWIFFLTNSLLKILLIIIIATLSVTKTIDSVDYLLTINIFINIVVPLPLLAVGIRRMHDIDLSGWFFGMLYIFIFLFYFLNRFIWAFELASPRNLYYIRIFLLITLCWVPMLIVGILCCIKNE